MPDISDEELAALTERAEAADALREQLAERDASIQEAQNAVTEARTAVASATDTVRDALVAANPAIPADLIKGDTIEALKDSVSTATAIANRLAEAAAAAPREKLGFALGAGSTRQNPSTEGMTPLQKITHGLATERDKHLA